MKSPPWKKRGKGAIVKIKGMGGGGGLMQPAWHRIQSTSPARCFAQKEKGQDSLLRKDLY